MKLLEADQPNSDYMFLKIGLFMQFESHILAFITIYFILVKAASKNWPYKQMPLPNQFLGFLNFYSSPENLEK